MTGEVKPLTDEELAVFEAAARACGPGPSLRETARNGKISFPDETIAVAAESSKEFVFVMVRPDAAQRLIAEVRRLRRVGTVGGECPVCDRIVDDVHSDHDLGRATYHHARERTSCTLQRNDFR